MNLSIKWTLFYQCLFTTLICLYVSLETFAKMLDDGLVNI